MANADNHLKTKKHKSSVEAAMSSFCVTLFFRADHSDESLPSATKEATFLYHAAIYGVF